MRAQFCLLLLTVCGLALLLFPFLQQQVPTRNDLPVLNLWLMQTQIFAVPAALFLLGFMKGQFIKFCQLAWGLWLGGLCVTVLWKVDQVSMVVTTYGFIFVATVALLCLALIVFSIIGLNPAQSKK